MGEEDEMDEIGPLGKNYSVVDKIIMSCLAGVGIAAGILLIYTDSFYQNKKQIQKPEKSTLIQKIQSPLPTPIVFKNDDGTTRPLYAHRNINGKIYFDNHQLVESEYGR